MPASWTDAADGNHGDLFGLIGRRTGATTRRAALVEARAFVAPPAVQATGSKGAYEETEAACRLWRQCRAVAGTHAKAYLDARGVSRCRFPELRCHAELRDRDVATVRGFPAVGAAVPSGAGDSGDGAILGVQRAWLDPCRPAEAGVASPRKALGRIRSFAVRFGMPL